MNKNKLNIFFLTLSLVVAIACKQPVEHNPALVGQWTGKNWLVAGKPSGLDAASVSFSFTADGNYNARFGEQTEEGTWYNKGDKLYTTAAGRKEIVVRILKADGAELDIEMNRGGQLEMLELVKVER